MNLATYLWKEWRDQRLAVVGFAAIVPVLLVASMLTIPGTWAGHPLLPSMVALAGVAVAALTLAADLVPGESRRNRLAFLARMPADLRASFLAKLVFLAAATALFAAWSYACTTVASALLRGGPWFPSMRLNLFQPGVAAIVAVLGWIFAVSCWLPRGTLALPASGLVLALGVGPLIAVCSACRGVSFHQGELELATLWLALAAPIVAALSFLRGLRHGGRIGRSALWGCTASALAFAPLWIRAAADRASFVRLDPSAASFHLEPVAVGLGGRFAFVNAGHVGWDERLHQSEFSATHALIVDLESGAWRDAGAPDDVFRCVGSRCDAAPAPFVELASCEEANRYGRLEWKDVIDARTAESLGGRQSVRVIKESGSLEAAANRTTNCVLLADGRRAWQQGETIWAARRDEEPMPLRGNVRGAALWWTIGHGFRCADDVYDATRERAYSLKSISHDFLYVRLVRAGKWIVDLDGQSLRTFASLRLWDPDTNELSPIVGDVREDALLVALHPDGRLFVVEPALRARESASGARSSARASASGAREAIPGELFLLDPETGARTTIDLPADVAKDLDHARFGGVTPGDGLLLELCDRFDRARGCWQDWWCARFDVATDEIRFTGPIPDPISTTLGCPDERSIVLIDGCRRIVRARFDGRPAELLFPR